MIPKYIFINFHSLILCWRVILNGSSYDYSPNTNLQMNPSLQIFKHFSVKWTLKKTLVYFAFLLFLRLFIASLITIINAALRISLYHLITLSFSVVLISINVFSKMTQFVLILFVAILSFLYILIHFSLSPSPYLLHKSQICWMVYLKASSMIIVYWIEQSYR